MARNMMIPFNSYVWNDWLSAQESQLVHLSVVEDVSDRVTRIMGGNPGSMQLQGTNTYCVGTGKSRILIDTGEGKPIWAENMTKFLRERNIDIAYILLTHWHGDHTGGVPDLISFDQRLAGRVYKNTPDPDQRPITDGEVFRVEGATLRAIHTPGHAVDHMCFVLEEENALFTGDNVLGHGFSVEEDLSAYIRSLQRMQSLECFIGYPAHGVWIEDLPARMALYIRHKEMRERQIVDALPRRKLIAGQPGVTIQALVKELHGELPPEVIALAVEPCVLQVLWKLAEERKAGFSCIKGNRQWFLIGRG